MIYFGVNLNCNSFRITALTDGFANLGTKYFNSEEVTKVRQWINSIKYNANEPCYWFFDAINYTKNRGETDFQYCHENENDYIYLINHRKLKNIIQFMNEFVSKIDPIMFDVDTTFILASAVRLFSFEEIESFKEYYAF